MCGISALVYDKKIHTLNRAKSIVSKCLDSYSYRGPDNRTEEVIVLDRSNICVMGHLRLSIIDLDERSNQPMHDKKDRYIISFNGEIYNYKELADTHSLDLKTTSDTEVLLELYSLMGKECVHLLNGMFAFVIVDKVTGTIFFARDHIGIKPLYYSKLGNSVLFMSEPKGAISSNFTRFFPNEKILFDFLSRGLRDHTDETMFENIFYVPSGHYGVIETSSTSRERYNIKLTKWFSVDKENPSGIDYVSYKQKLFTELFNSIHLRKRADVEVATTLSGGLDSSIVATVAKVNKTFTASFPGKDIDETKFAESVAKLNGLESHFITPNRQELVKELERSMIIQGEPTGGLSTYIQYFVFKRVNKDGIKVTLDGQGADELFMGYEFYNEHKFGLKQFLKKISPKWLWLKRIKKRLTFMNEDVINKYWDKKRCHYNPKSKKNFVYDQITSVMLPHLLAFADRNSMAFGVEARMPYLDPNIIKLVTREPLEWNKMNQKFQKLPLRELFSHVLPKDVAWREDKLGFAAPEKEWTRFFLNEIDKTLSHDKLFVNKFIKEGIVEKLMTNPEELSLFDRRLLWKIFQVEWWYNHFSNMQKSYF